MTSRSSESQNRTAHFGDGPTMDAVLDLLRDTIPSLIAVYQFGSAGTSYERPSSDLDLAFLATRPEDPVAIWNTAQKVAIQLGRDVDLVDLRRASTVMAAHIITSGAQLMCANVVACAEFEVYALSSYAYLNEERAGILEDIQARGSVHAG